MRQCYQVEGCNTTNPIMSSFSNFVLKKQDKSQEHYQLQPAAYALTKTKPRAVCCQEGKDDEDMTSSDTTMDYEVSLFQINLSCEFKNKLNLMI